MGWLATLVAKLRPAQAAPDAQEDADVAAVEAVVAQAPPPPAPPLPARPRVLRSYGAVPGTGDVKITVTEYDADGGMERVLTRRDADLTALAVARGQTTWDETDLMAATGSMSEADYKAATAPPFEPFVPQAGP